MKTTDMIQRVRSCESMYEAGRAATAHFLKTCQSDPSHIVSAACFRVRDIRNCHDDLEHTYLIRMFTIFEAALRAFWKHTSGKRSRPKASWLLNRIGATCYMPADHLLGAHGVREFRNTLVHGGTSKAMRLGEARSYLCKFLSNLPREW